MNNYIKRKEYKLPNGKTVTADFNELGCAMVTIQAMDALFDILNSSVEVVRCKDCKYLFSDNDCPLRCWRTHIENDFCSYGERAEQ